MKNLFSPKESHWAYKPYLAAGPSSRLTAKWTQRHILKLVLSHSALSELFFSIMTSGLVFFWDLCAQVCMCLHLYVVLVLFLWLFSPIYLFCPLWFVCFYFYSFFDAHLFSNVSKKGCDLGWVERWPRSGRSYGGDTVIRILDEKIYFQ